MISFVAIIFAVSRPVRPRGERGSYGDTTRRDNTFPTARGSFSGLSGLGNSGAAALARGWPPRRCASLALLTRFNRHHLRGVIAPREHEPPLREHLSAVVGPVGHVADCEREATSEKPPPRSL